MTSVERKIAAVDAATVRRVERYLSVPGNEYASGSQIAYALGIGKTTAVYARARLDRPHIVPIAESVAACQRRPKPVDHPELFAHFEPGCVVFWANRRWLLLMFEGRAAVLYCEGRKETAVPYADEIEYVSPPTEESAAWARKRIPKGVATWFGRPEALNHKEQRQ